MIPSKPTVSNTNAIRDRIRGNFDRAAVDYAHFESVNGFFRGMTESLLSKAPPMTGKCVLDVGCGSGASSEPLVRAVGPSGRVVGIDISAGMLREARSAFQSSVLFVQADACRYRSLFRVRFDAILYNAVIFMLPEAARSLADAAVVLSSDGVLLLSSLEGVTVGSDRRPVPEALNELGHRTGRHALSPWARVTEQLHALFDDVETTERSVVLSPETFFAFYGMEPMSAGLLPSVEYPARRQVVKAFSDQCAEDGSLLEQGWRLAIARRPRQEPKQVQ